MAQIFIRVELLGTPSKTDYDNLHALMEANKWYRAIVGISGGQNVTVSLPHAMYQGISNSVALDVANAVEAIIVKQVWTKAIVLVMVATDWGQV